MATNGESMTCPFCGFIESSDYGMLLHIEIHHSENGESPFAVSDTQTATEHGSKELVPSSRGDETIESPSKAGYIDCPYHCGERILATDLPSHADFHLAEDMALEDEDILSGIERSTDTHHNEDNAKDIVNAFTTKISPSLRNSGQPPGQHHYSLKKRAPSLKELFFGLSSRRSKALASETSQGETIKRLGRAELGPYAHEKRMPASLQRLLEEGAKVTIYNKIGPNGALVRVEAIANETPDLIPTLARLSILDRKVARAFYCSPSVRHIVKMRNEGGFCGYRNIQMLISYVQDAAAPGHANFPGKLPSILKLQDMIEEAWDRGFNPTARIETGGIKLTRKFIGTPEAQALLSSLDIHCEAVAYSTKPDAEAYISLLQAIFEYFDDDDSDLAHQVVITEKPPIYFQHRGHSMTIVGVEVNCSGAANLVVFDPMFNPSPTMKSLVGDTKFHCRNPAQVLKAYRRGERYLSKYKDFEILKINGPSTDARRSEVDTRMEEL